jgi:hypothetical protein
VSVTVLCSLSTAYSAISSSHQRDQTLLLASLVNASMIYMTAIQSLVSLVQGPETTRKRTVKMTPEYLTKHPAFL